MRRNEASTYKVMSNYELHEILTGYGFDAHQKRMAKRELNKRQRAKKLVKV